MIVGNLHFLKCYQPSLRINVGLQDLTLVTNLNQLHRDHERMGNMGEWVDQFLMIPLSHYPIILLGEWVKETICQFLVI